VKNTVPPGSLLGQAVTFFVTQDLNFQLTLSLQKLDTPVNKPYFHHVLIASDDLERSRQFYSEVLELEEINRPAFAYPGIWYQIGGGQQQLHIIVHPEATLRRNKANDPNDIHFALRLESYRDTLAWLRSKGFRDDVPADDLRKMELLPTSLAGWPQIYILDPDRNIIEFSFETID
jgi:glyoxylase I family protein